MWQAHLEESEFNHFASLIYQLTGINLGTAKRQLLATRLGKRLRICNIESFSSYRKFITSEEGREELQHMIDAVSTNKTSFFREPAHFQFLQKNILPNFANRPFRLWCNACSTGEEPYTIAMILAETIPNWKNRDIKILATDISTRVLASARQGIYSHCEGSIPPALLRTAFLKGHDRWQGHFLVRDEIKNLIRFRYLNLMEQFPFTGRFDVIFCRNVMIYFDKTTQANLVERLVGCLNPGGHLFIGHSESLAGIARSSLQYVMPSVYRCL